MHISTTALLLLTASEAPRVLQAAPSPLYRLAPSLLCIHCCLHPQQQTLHLNKLLILLLLLLLLLLVLTLLLLLLLLLLLVS
jgi:hypothetical protein